MAKELQSSQNVYLNGVDITCLVPDDAVVQQGLQSIELYDTDDTGRFVVDSSTQHPNKVRVRGVVEVGTCEWSTLDRQYRLIQAERRIAKEEMLEVVGMQFPGSRRVM